jgi:hypothetical protein
MSERDFIMTSTKIFKLIAVGNARRLTRGDFGVGVELAALRFQIG